MNGVTLNIPSYRSPTSLPSITGSPEIKPEIFGGLYSQSGVLDSMAYLGASTSFTPVTSPNEMKPVVNKRHSGDTTEERNTAMDRLAETHEPLDIQRLVEEFRVTLERYGVSQRNLSFLMEKGRVKRWEELSPRGRVPYIKMRMWLDSREEQARKSGPREAYNRRERFSMFQLHVLCRLFEENPNPAMNVRNAVAERLNIPLDRVNVWFQNQRARGFPAKRILQQQNGVYSSTGLEHETEASKIISSCASEQASAVSLQTTPDKIPPNMADYLLQIPLSGECIGNYHSKEHKPDVRQLNNTKVKTEPHIQ
ncbi:DUXA-like protein, partial [Mya arenaria]